MYSSLKITLLTTVLTFVTACSLAPVPSLGNNTYILNKVPILTKSTQPEAINLLVNPPQTSPIYSTKFIPYSTRAYSIGYLVKNTWLLPPSQMFQQLLQSTLNNTNYFSYVGIDSSNNNYDLVLNSYINKFLFNYTTSQPTVDLIITVELSNNSKIIAHTTLAVQEPFNATEIYSGIISANNAVAKTLTQLSTWCINAARNTSVKKKLV